MALNFPPFAIFPANPVEDELVSPPFHTADGFAGGAISNPRRFDWGIGRPCDFRRDGFGDGGGSCGDSIVGDVVGLLSSDPFGMGMDLDSTFTAIAGWLEDFEAQSGLNFLWDRAMVLESGAAGNAGEEPIDSECLSVWDVDELLYSSDEDENQVFSCRAEVVEDHGVGCVDGDEGTPHEALYFALGYLDLLGLLSVQMVCKSLHFAVCNDALLWRSIHIDQPLNEKITDDDLLRLVGRAQGNLECLSLVECPRITDNGLKRVLECNPRLTKLSVPGCRRVSIEGLVNNLKAIGSHGVPSIKCLQIGGLYGITPQHYKELKLLLGEDKCQQPETPKPQRFYHCSRLLSSCDDGRAIDIEMCPRCQNLRLVYDCPAESCQGKQPASQQCRACTFCIARCIQCGRCVNDGEYEETFCLDLLCSGCLKLHEFEDGQEGNGACFRHTFSNQEAR
ncbi:hypothetical protein ACLOJK_012073 [Asimina triloba]